MAEAISGPGRERPGVELSPDQALKLLKDHGVINKTITWKRLEEVSKLIGSGGGRPWEYRWCFIVKGKNIYRDDDPKA